MKDNSIIDWVRVIGSIVVSWPVVALIFILFFRAPLFKLINRFTESSGSKAEIGPLKIELGTPVLPPQYRGTGIERAAETIDLSDEIGPIGDTGPEGTTVGFSVAYAMQAAIKNATGRTVALSPRSIYVTAKKYDEWPGEDYEGTSVLGALKAVREVGAYLESDWPYSNKTKPKSGTNPAYRISSYTEVRGVEQILSAIRERKGVIAAVTVTEDFDKTDPDGRVTIRLPLRQLGAKTICLVGYDGERGEFKFANDWGPNWGLRGFGIIRDTDLLRILQTAYTLDM